MTYASRVKAIRRFTVRTALPEALSGLSELASNLRWSWHQPTREVFERLDPERWEAVHEDPTALLAEFTPSEWARLATDSDVVRCINEAHADLQQYLTGDRWYQREHPDGPAAIAYFSPEYGITHVLPQYSGGLGILAGDHLKAASDLGVPIIGVGLLYASGYFNQALTPDGWQTESYPVLDPDGLPLTLLREPDGRASRITVEMPGGRLLRAHVWRADVGRVPLLLLDSAVPDNDEDLRNITDRLYGGGGEHRIQQEMLLGIGGVRALRLWSRLSGAPEPAVFHTNEGHAGFLGLERMREYSEMGLTFDEAREATRAGTVFTTHTPVPAGIDRFGKDMVSRFLGDSGVLGNLDIRQVLALGAEDYAEGDPTVFNMAVMGLRLAGRANGVSQLHGRVSREMFGGLWAGFDNEEVPITSITNGVHAPTWIHPALTDLASKYLGDDAVTAEEHYGRFDKIPAAELWALRKQMRTELIEFARRLTRESMQHRGASPAQLGWVDNQFDPDVLTIGFARRVPTYKRLTLMLRDPERLRALLLHPERPVQLLIAGKSHPADEQGKRLIQEMVTFADEADVRHRIAFLPDYGIRLAQRLYPGCDVWLNNPLRPLEACGTSGMKSALNGGLNLSILDGWWDEWFDGENGWEIPTAGDETDEDVRDDLESNALYDLLEQAVTPAFYQRDEDGLPKRWLSMMFHTHKYLAPKVLAARMVSDYTNKLYVGAHKSAVTMNKSSCALARDLAAWKVLLARRWKDVRVELVESRGLEESPQIGDTLHVSAHVELGELEPKDVAVQVVYGKVDEGDTIRSPKEIQVLTHQATYEGGRHHFEGEVELQRTGSFGYTVRVVPAHDGLVAPAEMGLVVNA